MSIKAEEDLLKHLLKIEAKDVNLKFIFDHIRNYGICGLMVGIGAHVLAHPDKTSFLSAMLDLLAGAALFALPWGLFALNFFHGVLAFLALSNSKDFNDFNGFSKFWYLVIYLLLFFAATKLMLFAVHLNPVSS